MSVLRRVGSWMRLRWRRVAVAALIVGLGIGATRFPGVLRDMETFRVQRVAVVGTSLLAPHEVLKASGITATSSVFDAPEVWRAGVLEHPMVTEVRIERQLPGTVVLIVTEEAPVALVSPRELKPVNAEGRLLPIRLAGRDLDLPILAVASDVGPDGLLADETSRRLAGALGAIGRLDRSLLQQISEAAAGPGGSLRVLLRDPVGVEALLPAEPDAARLDQLRLAVRDLVGRGEEQRLRRLDARFADQVVIALNPDTPVK